MSYDHARINWTKMNGRVFFKLTLVGILNIEEAKQIIEKNANEEGWKFRRNENGIIVETEQVTIKLTNAEIEREVQRERRRLKVTT